MYLICNTIYLMRSFLPPATKFGQGYVFTGMCDSVHGGGGGGSASVHAGIPPWEQTPPPRSRPPPRPGRPPLEQTPPGRHPPPQTRHPPGQALPPGTEHAGRYGQCAGGTHPTGMQSCFRHVKASFTLILNVTIFRRSTFVLFYGHFNGQNGSANPFCL